MQHSSIFNPYHGEQHVMGEESRSIRSKPPTSGKIIQANSPMPLVRALRPMPPMEAGNLKNSPAENRIEHASPVNLGLKGRHLNPTATTRSLLWYNPTLRIISFPPKTTRLIFLYCLWVFFKSTDFKPGLDRFTVQWYQVYCSCQTFDADNSVKIDKTINTFSRLCSFTFYSNKNYCDDAKSEIQFKKPTWAISFLSPRS